VEAAFAKQLHSRLMDPLSTCCTVTARCAARHMAPLSEHEARSRRQSFDGPGGDNLVRFYESSPGHHRSFCSVCGSNLISKFDERPQVLGLALGVFDDDPVSRPLCHIFVGSKASWHEITDSLPRFDDQHGDAGAAEQLPPRHRQRAVCRRFDPAHFQLDRSGGLAQHRHAQRERIRRDSGVIAVICAANRRWWLAYVSIAAILGCDTSAEKSARFLPAPELAEQALASALDGWKSGQEPSSVGSPQRRVIVADSHRRPAQTLRAYKIVGEAPMDGGRRFVVRLSLENPSQEERAKFLIVGVDPLWVFRQEDYDMIAHWDHPMPDEAATETPNESTPNEADAP